ncbi:MAG: DUF1549 domain-containing protein [Planctomycetota bacterium]
MSTFFAVARTSTRGRRLLVSTVFAIGFAVGFRCPLDNGPATAQADPPPAKQAATNASRGKGGSGALAVFPRELRLRGQGDRQSLVVQWVDSEGTTRDVTAEAQLTIADAKLSVLDGASVRGMADGTTKLVVRHGQASAEIPVAVEQSGSARPISFRLDIMPIFMKHGCNNGSCHGSARGKDGFMLSLFGYDPAGDYFRLTRQIIGRRLDLAAPEKSLLLEKATGSVAHTGGQLFDEQHEDYKTVMAWLRAGAPDDSGATPEPLGIELVPPKMVFGGDATSQRTVVMARYSDGSIRDVSRLALFMSNNESVASIGKDGMVKGNGRGGAFVFARFNKFTVGSEVIVLPTDDRFAWPETPTHNYIDTLVFDKLRKLHMAPSELCSDEMFLRRVYLDLIGLPPSREEFDRFMADADPLKRSKLIDQLLDRDEFVDIWAMKWGELLRIRAVNNQPQYGRDAKAMWTYSAWVRDQMAANRPINAFVADLITGSGSNLKSPTSNLYTAAERLTPLKTAEDIAQVFLGTRIQCAQCHNHPFDRWTMDDYYGFASFFAGVNMKRGVEGREVIVYNNNSANTVEHPVDGRRMKPKELGGAEPEVDGKDPRQALAAWLTSGENEAFRQTMANVIWAHFFGRGIVEPVDDVRISNPPSNKELLDAIGLKLAEYGFDKKKLIRDICNSRTYQLSSATNPTNELDDAYFSHGYVRRLRAEVLLDVITRVTGTEDRFPQSPPGTRAVQLYSGSLSNYFLTTFGRAPRESACSCEVNREANLSQALHLVNGDTVTQKIAASRLIPTLLQEKKSTAEIITEMYVRVLSRKPTADEVRKLEDIVNSESSDPNRAVELAALQARADVSYRRLEELLAKLKADYEKLMNDGQEEAALETLRQQMANAERQLAASRQRFQGQTHNLVYADILWGLFNSTEFAFNH